MNTAEKLMSDLLALPDNERQNVALKLLGSLSGPDLQHGMSDTAWLAELERRATEATHGVSETKPAEQVLNSLAQRYAR